MYYMYTCSIGRSMHYKKEKRTHAVTAKEKHDYEICYT